MSKTVKGRVQSVNDREDNDWFGICIDDTWYNGDDSLTQDVEGFKLEIEYEDQDDWNKIQKINVIEEDSEGGQNTANSNAGSGGASKSGKSSSNPNPKRANIQATAATKKAADIVAERGNIDDGGDYVDQVSTVANGLNEIMNKLYEANME